MAGKRVGGFLGILIFFVVAGAASLAAQDVQARWGLEANRAVVGQGLSLNIQIQGEDIFDPPVISIPGVDVLWQGGSPRNATSIVSMNGQTTRTVTKGFTGAWSLKARKPGSYHLPGISLNLKGTVINLPALDWSVTEARQNDGFFVRQELAPATTVLGLELTYRFTWFLAKSAQNPDFTLPILDSPDIEFVEQPRIPPGKDQFRINYRGHELIGIKSSQVVSGQQFTTLSLEFKVRPKKTGTWDLSDSGVTFQGMTGTRKVQDFFGDLVDEPQYDTLVARAQALKLVVTELPLTGKPGVFSGLIGKLDLAWSGVGGKYQVGEPIRLTLRLKGVQNKPDLDLDHMVTQALSGDDFSVIPDPEPPKPGIQDSLVMERAYIFRARHGGTLTIPPLRLNYFDPESRNYGETSSKALDLQIEGDAASQGAGNSPSSQGSRTSPGAGIQGTVVAAGPDSPGGGEPVNPPGLMETRMVSGTIFVIVPLVMALAGLAAGAYGWWMHSTLRRRRLRHRAWIALLEPFPTIDPREILVQGRQRLSSIRAFLQAEHRDVPGSPTGEDVRMQRLQEEMEAWDLAYFGPAQADAGGGGLRYDSAGNTPDVETASTAWHGRWTQFCRDAEAWS